MASEKQVNVRLPNELVDWLKGYAKEHRRSVTNLLTVMLEQEQIRVSKQQQPNFGQ